MTPTDLAQSVSETYHSLTRHSDPKKLEEIKRLKYKVFYSSLDTWDKPCGRVLMGMFPGAPGQYEYPAEVVNRVPESGWNAWLNEKWEPVKVVENLEALWRAWFGGHNWQQELMRTFCSNVCPLRAPSEGALFELYDESVMESFLPLWEQVFAQLKPRLMIVHGNKEGLSPYSLLSRLYPDDGQKQQSSPALGSLKVRWHVHNAAWGPLAVVGLPHLGKGKPALLLQNTMLAEFIRKHDAPRRSEMRVVRKQ